VRILLAALGSSDRFAADADVLFHLLHIGRGGHDEWMQRARLEECVL
jgi:hypothetical protein